MTTLHDSSFRHQTHLWRLFALPMPSTTERQQITEALHKALLFNLIIEAEQDMESSDSSSGTSDDDTLESESEEGPSQVEDHLHSIAA